MDTSLENQPTITNNKWTKEDLTVSIQNAVKIISEKQGFIHYDVYKKVISSEGGNWLGDLYEIDIKGETAEGHKDEINIFVKRMISNSDNIKIITISEIYDRERFVYGELTKVFTELQDKANIPINKRLKFAKFYEEGNNDVIMLENMMKQGFKTYSRCEIMNLNYAELAVEHLAKFHTMSFVLQKRMPKYYESKIESLKELFTFDAKAKEFMNNIYELATEKFSPELKMKTDMWWPTVVPDYFKYLQGTMTKVKCLCHGDYKMNNVMYKEIEGEIAEVIAVDFQIAHYGSPILDLIYFLYMGTDQKFRKEHLAHLKHHYYISLKTYLDHFDVLVEDIYPIHEFEEDFENCLDYALVSCIWILPFAMIAQDEDLDLGDYEKVQTRIRFEDSYYDRLQGVFDDCFKWKLF